MIGVGINKFCLRNVPYSKCFQDSGTLWPGEDKIKNYDPVAEISLFRQIDDEWRKWMTENLLMDVAPENIVTTMEANGFARNAVLMEINHTLRNAYLRGARQFSNRLKKRD